MNNKKEKQFLAAGLRLAKHIRGGIRSHVENKKRLHLEDLQHQIRYIIEHGKEIKIEQSIRIKMSELFKNQTSLSEIDFLILYYEKFYAIGMTGITIEKILDCNQHEIDILYNFKTVVKCEWKLARLGILPTKESKNDQ